MPPTLVENPTPVGALGGGSRPSSGHDGSEQEWEVLAMEAEEEDVYLRELAGVDSLEQATSLQIVINTTTSTISHLGAKLVALEELNLNNSVIASLRDLGTGFKCLTVLWVSRCGLSGLEGLTAMPVLRELYASFNDISDLQPLDSCAELEVLDLEGNCVAGLDSAIYLTACSLLQSLNLSGNPVTELEAYRQQVASVLPSLQTLDDMQVEDSERVVGQYGPGSSTAASAAAARSSPGGPVGSLPPDMEAAGEMAIVCQGIKHARVGVDSHEFQEIEMAMLLEGSGLTGGGGVTGGLVPQTSGSDGCLMVGAGPGGRPCTSSPIMPLSAGTWIRALRASQTGSLAALRASREAASASGGGVGRPGSTGSMGHSPGSSRPATAQGADSNGGPSGTGPGGIPRPVSASLRPFSARLGSAGPGGAGGVRPGTGASAPPTAGGLYWKKHRLHGPASASATDSLLDAVAAAAEQEEGAASGSSTLTFGGDAIGGSLAKDLRRRRKGAAAGGAGGSAAGAVPGVRAGAAGPSGSGDGLGPGPSLLRNQSMGPFGGGVSTSYDTAALMEELRRWKVETADRALMPEEGPSDGAWGVGGGSASGSGSGGGEGGQDGHADILDLEEAQGPSFFLSDEVSMAGEAGGGLGGRGSGTGPRSSSHTGSAGGEERDSGGGRHSGAAGSIPREILERAVSGSTSMHRDAHHLGVPALSTSPPLPRSPMRAGPHTAAGVLAPVHVPPGARSAHRTMLAKVVRDVAAPSAGSPSIAGPRSPLRVPSARVREEVGGGPPLGAHISRQPSAGPASPQALRSPSHTRHAAQSQGTPTRPPSHSHSTSRGPLSDSSSSQHAGTVDQRPTSGRQGSGSSAQSATASLSRPESARYHVTCVVGELDLAAANPRPVVREDAAADSDEGDAYA